MLTRLRVRNFKRFEELDVELGDPVVFVGPNNSGKTTAMQALAMWDCGLRAWSGKYADRTVPAKRPGVTVGRRDIVSVPVPTARLLWRNQSVRRISRDTGRQVTSNILIEVLVDGVAADGSAWRCGMEFDYANPESVYCRSMRIDGSDWERMPVPSAVLETPTAFLGPMSGLAANEARLDPGAVDVRIGEGRTSDVLRNLCHSLRNDDPDQWEAVARRMRTLFGVELDPPVYLPHRGEITMSYREHGRTLDLSAAGRGMHQTLLLLAFLGARPGAVLLLDEPDAHLEILRQRDAYRSLTRAARETGGQVIAATHSEVLLNEAATNDAVVAFVGRPHRLERRNQLSKALSLIGWDQYHQAEQTGWVLYLEDSTDLDILRAFARRLNHEPALAALEKPFLRSVLNQPRKARRHFHGLREAFPALRGVALFDRLERLPEDGGIAFLMWSKREIENYLCSRRTLEAFARDPKRERSLGPVFVEAMRTAIEGVESALARLGKPSPWGGDLKVSDEFLVPLFKSYFAELEQYNTMPKNELHRLVEYVPDDEIDEEVREKLDVIGSVAAAG